METEPQPPSPHELGKPVTGGGTDEDQLVGDLSEDKKPRDDLASPTASSDVQRIERADKVRREALWSILFLFGLVIAYGAVGAFFGGEVWTNTKEYLQIVLAGITGLVGLVMGYYFGRGQMP